MKYLFLSALTVLLFSCKKESISIDNLETNIESINEMGAVTSTFQYGEDIALRYTLTNTSKYAINYYNDNCPMMSARVYDGSNSLVGDLYADSISCHEALLLKTLQSKEQAVFRANWFDDPNNAPLPVGTYKVIVTDDIELSDSPESKDIVLYLDFTVQ